VGSEHRDPTRGADVEADGMTEGRPPSRLRGRFHTAFANLSLGCKVALIPALTLLLMGLMLGVAVQMSERNTAALRALDRDVFEPLNRAQTLIDAITLLHTRLFVLLSMGTNEANPVAQKANAEALILRLDTEVASFGHFLDATSAVPPPVAARLRAEFAAYAVRVRETAGFAAYDASYGELLAGVTDDRFGQLRADLDALVQVFAQRRVALARDAVGNSLNARELLLGLGLGAVVLGLLGSVVVGRGIARPVLRLTALMNRLAGGDTDLAVPATERQDEVGAMARAVEVFRANAIARHQGEVVLRRTNMQFDAALNSMLQGMVVWGSDDRVQLVNRRFFAILGMQTGSIGPGMTVREVTDTAVRHGLYPDEDPGEVCLKLTTLLTRRRSMQIEMAMRPGLLVRVASEPMANGGAVVTFEDVTEKRHNEEQIVFMARHDALTSLPNRTLFQDHMEAAAAGLGEGLPFAVLCLDLDRFKEVNDTLGHAAGDELLRLVAGRLRHSVRDHDVVARLGGDEFAVVTANATGSPVAPTLLATRIVESIGAPYEVQGHNIIIGTSIGIALSEPGVPSAELLKRADVALYRAKEERGTFAFFEPGMNEQLHVRRELEVDLRLAVQRGEFELNYQPLYNLEENRVTAFEALLRWNSPTRGRVSPADFIPLAERTGLIIPLGEWVLREACAEAAAWPDHVRVAVNLSPVQFNNRRLVTIVRETLAETGLPARRLELEITETALLQDTEAVMTTLYSLHGLGLRVSMDDFGTGYSSLSYLHRFPFDKIKIDRSFVSDLRIAPLDATGATGGTLSSAAKSAAMIVRAITGLGRNLGITTTAEGVETAEQLAQIRREGCTEVQGYFISPARPAAEIAALLRRLDTTLPAISGNLRASPQLVA
jgi:diguanylate cyclase (GGDEF)-like protein